MYSRALPSDYRLMGCKFLVVTLREYVCGTIFPVLVSARPFEELNVVPMLWIPASIFPI